MPRLRRRLEDLETASKSAPMEDVLERMEAMVQARVESALMGPARRPPLAHEVRSAPVELPVQGGYVVGSSHPPSVAGPSSAPPRVEAPGPSGAGPSGGQARSAGPAPRRTTNGAAKKPEERRTGGAKKKPVPPPQQPPREPRPLPPAPVSMDREWTVVVGKRKKPRSGAAPAASPQQPPRRAEPKTSPATLCGRHYLFDAGGSVQGAHIQTGPDGGAGQVAAALSKAGECSLEAVKVGQVRPDRFGVGSAWVRMPMKAAQKAGHKARECDAAPNCAVCAASVEARRAPARGKACPAPSRRNQRRAPKRSAVAAVAVSQPQTADPPQVAMEVVEVVRPLAEFETFLIQLGSLVEQGQPRPTIVAGDFNAKSVVWGSPAT
ncbi:ESX-1 secretion-associated protein EspI-like [Manduca sexta]|uniref:ESX-1 secretion-associated protein EspI-like n=1 Tax=Manduca sexta TaxID=7130 RepID=UPI00188DF318|nr:ESX-1 secretion-associated protein EspI-like [Manduca sexta]